MYEGQGGVTLGVVGRRLHSGDSGVLTKVGGAPLWHSQPAASRPALVCAQCDTNLKLIFTLNADVDEPFPLLRSLYVFACMRTSCGALTWRVLRDQTHRSAASAVVSEVASIDATHAKDEPVSAPTTSTWDLLATDLSDALELETLDALLAQRDERAKPAPPIQTAKKTKAKPVSKPIDSDLGWLVEDVSEPHENSVMYSSAEEVHIASKLRAYLEDEEDGEIAALIGGLAPGIDSAIDDDDEDDDGGDADERKLGRSDAASVVELRFLQRVALERRQVLRYAYGGEPMWCSHPPPTASTAVPRCEWCGGDRVFEAQLMPALIPYVSGPSEKDDKDMETVAGMNMSREAIEAQRSRLRRAGGFDFGVVAIWSCARSCPNGCEEFVVVQPPSDNF